MAVRGLKVVAPIITAPIVVLPRGAIIPSAPKPASPLDPRPQSAPTAFARIGGCIFRIAIWRMMVGEDGRVLIPNLGRNAGVSKGDFPHNAFRRIGREERRSSAFSFPNTTLARVGNRDMRACMSIFAGRPRLSPPWDRRSKSRRRYFLLNDYSADRLGARRPHDDGPLDCQKWSARVTVTPHGGGA